MTEPCWGYHASDIPADTEAVVDIVGRQHERHHGGWIHVAIVDGDKEYGSWMTEEGLLATFGPVRCPVREQKLAEVATRRAGR
jgi:hypothetical protein